MHRLQANSPDTTTLDRRVKLLTRRVHTVMLTFFANRNYFSEKPNITWDNSFVPPELYDDLETKLASIDAKESQQVQKEKVGESQGKNKEEQIAKEKDKSMQKDKGKAKDTEQDKENPDVAEYPKRKWMQKTSESSVVIGITSDDEDDASADVAEPPAKRVKHSNKSIDHVDINPVPPCRQCTSSQMECNLNGWSVVCKNCPNAEWTCSLSKAKYPSHNSNVIPNITGDTENPTSLLSKSIAELDRRSLNEDENDVDQLDSILHQSKIKSKTPPKASKLMEEGSSSITSRNFDLEHMQQQLKVSQVELQIAQQQLQLANSRIEAQQNFYEAQRDLYEAQLADYRLQMRGQGNGKAKEKA